MDDRDRGRQERSIYFHRSVGMIGVGLKGPRIASREPGFGPIRASRTGTGSGGPVDRSITAFPPPLRSIQEGIILTINLVFQPGRNFALGFTMNRLRWARPPTAGGARTARESTNELSPVATGHARRVHSRSKTTIRSSFGPLRRRSRIDGLLDQLFHPPAKSFGRRRLGDAESLAEFGQ